MTGSSILLALLLFHLPLVSEGETRYTPEGGIKPSKGKVGVEQVRLLDPQDVFERNTSAEKVAELIKDIEAIVIRTVPEDAAAFELLVKATLSVKERPQIELSSRGKAPKPILQGISDALEKTADIRSKADPLRLEIHFVIKAKP